MHKLYLLLFFCLYILTLPVSAQKNLKTEHVILITLDGYRWQELFTGADPGLIDDKDFVKNRDELKTLFWHNDPLIRRKKLMPFIWNTIVTQGQIAGNRQYDNKVNVTNKFRSSYPGYNELLTGFADDRITGNDKKDNPNKTILEFVHQHRGFHGKVAAFGSWELFPYILRSKTSGIPVNAGYETAKALRLTDREKLLNQLQPIMPSPWGSVRLDAFTHHYAMEYLKKHNPRLLYIAFGETDDFAHDGDYESYLKSAHKTDAFLKDLWNWLQLTPRYKNNTTLIITTDHGRGIGNAWKNHGTLIAYSDETWFIAIGPDTKPLGELGRPGQFYTNQIAKTIATFLQVNYTNDRSVGEPITSIIGK